MVSINFQRNADGLWQGFDVSGHTGYAEKGKDIICAGVSAVTQTAVAGLKNYLPREKLEIKKKSGLLMCRVKSKKAAENPEVQAILTAAFLGLQGIAQSYAGYLRLTVNTTSKECSKRSTIDTRSLRRCNR